MNSKQRRKFHLPLMRHFAEDAIQNQVRLKTTNFLMCFILLVRQSSVLGMLSFTPTTHATS
jgi:hypothetical protein